MRIINEAHLEAVINDKSSKKINCQECDTTMMQLVYIQHNSFKLIENDFSKFELASWIKSKKLYLDKKDENTYIKYYPKEIVYVDLSSNISGELSYEHPCVVMKNNYDKVFVVPCSSGKLNRVYNKKTGDLFPEYMVGTQKDGFTKPTVLILNNAKWISKSRIKRKFKNPVTNDFFDDLYNRLFGYLFEAKQYQSLKQQEIINTLNKENEELKNENLKLERENLQLTEQINKLISSNKYNELIKG